MKGNPTPEPTQGDIMWCIRCGAARQHWGDRAKQQGEYVEAALVTTVGVTTAAAASTRRALTELADAVQDVVNRGGMSNAPELLSALQEARTVLKRT